jgi:hypothetical protein
VNQELPKNHGASRADKLLKTIQKIFASSKPELIKYARSGSNKRILSGLVVLDQINLANTVSEIENDLMRCDGGQLFELAVIVFRLLQGRIVVYSKDNTREYLLSTALGWIFVKLVLNLPHNAIRNQLADDCIAVIVGLVGQRRMVGSDVSSDLDAAHKLTRFFEILCDAYGSGFTNFARKLTSSRKARIDRVNVNRVIR